MQFKATALQAAFIRSSTWSGGTPGQMGALVDICDKLDAQIIEPLAELGVILGDNGGIHWQAGATLDATVTIDLSAQELATLHDAVRTRRWQEMDRAITRIVVALPEWLNTLSQEARECEAFQRLPAERRKALAERA
jgi:hypothetical protein